MWAWGELRNGGIRICGCGEVTLEDEMHWCAARRPPEPGPVPARLAPTEAGASMRKGLRLK